MTSDKEILSTIPDSHVESTDTEKESVSKGAYIDISIEEVSKEENADLESLSSIDNNKWYNKSKTIFGYKLLPYSQGRSQILMVSFVVFMIVGMSSAIGGLGAGGTLNATVVNNSNVAVYTAFAFLAFFCGPICNKIGVRATLCFGGWGYALYYGSLLCYNKTGNGTFVIASGAIEGLCAAFLWTAQGNIMLSYSEEENKGKNIARFWAIFQMGNVIGSLVPLIQTIHSTSETLADSTYIAFIVIISTGAIMATMLLPTRLVRKADGTRVILKKNPTWKSEMKALWTVLKLQPWFIGMFPMFWSSNWFMTYESNDYNLVQFNLRTRSLNNLMFAIFEVLGAFSAGYLLDSRFCSRKTMARIGWGLLMGFTLIIWGGGLKSQLRYTRQTVDDDELSLLDWTSSGYGAYLVLYMLYGAFDAWWQTYSYWVMGSLTNSSRKLAIYTGFYKSIQSAGAAVVWRLDALDTPYMAMFGSTWGLLLGSLLIASPVIYSRILEETDPDDDIKFTEND
ncbi:hypothetical protein PACTADRAFT_41277 [Pachysolen tannophilus NRRL Y-2460]|uniref:Major facilitator superfamily (MFS) profile domain-containing protein n=1 Tax=Pachysolen tannophilus NRRL Y-2460 TaxID=669874 RepID=A0A1E4TXS4_PACTA|nr:hypothetical protein PACTADRAFT_41277 [Pachysolen tannophilus NRRL Y-2460]